MFYFEVVLVVRLAAGAGVGAREEETERPAHPRRLHQPRRHRPAPSRLPERAAQHRGDGETSLFYTARLYISCCLLKRAQTKPSLKPDSVIS